MTIKRNLSENFNKNESLEIFDKLKKEYNKSPVTFGSNSGKKEALLELLIIIGNQIATEYKDLNIVFKLGLPHIEKGKKDG